MSESLAREMWYCEALGYGYWIYGQKSHGIVVGGLSEDVARLLVKEHNELIGLRG
jgi:hypothetical protein